MRDDVTPDPQGAAPVIDAYMILLQAQRNQPPQHPRAAFAENPAFYEIFTKGGVAMALIEMLLNHIAVIVLKPSVGIVFLPLLKQFFVPGYFFQAPVSVEVGISVRGLFLGHGKIRQSAYCGAGRGTNTVPRFNCSPFLVQVDLGVQVLRGIADPLHPPVKFEQSSVRPSLRMLL